MNWVQQVGQWLARLRFWYVVRPWELALRIRAGRRIVDVAPGLHLKLPLLDEIIIQNRRLRVLNLPIQTVTSRAGTTVTLSAMVGWRITGLRQMYETLHVPEDWIYNEALAALATALYEADGRIDLPTIAGAAAATLAASGGHGLAIETVRITDAARVKTYRLITGEGNQGWSWHRMGALEPRETPRQ